MTAINRFKQDFGYYFLGLIVPGLLNAAMIPIIKHLLGTEIFGAYSLKFNFLLLLMATLIGGICQGVIRFKVGAENKMPVFYQQVFLLAKYLLIPVIIICFGLFLFIFHQTTLLSFLFVLCVIGGSLQNVLMGIAQANFQSKFIMLSEGIRAVVFFLCSIIALSFIKHYPQELLFVCLFLSYVVSDMLLAKKNKITVANIFGFIRLKENAFKTKDFLKYGFPLSLWLATYYLCTYLDKPLLAHDFGLTIQGNYQALFDIIFRGITGFMSPFPIAVLPILTHAFQQEKKQNAFNLLRKLIVVQIAIMLTGAVFYWFFGFDILAKILSIPFTNDYKISGLIMIVACMVWQIGILNHKPFKLEKRTDLLLKFVLTSLVVYLISFFIIKIFFTNLFYCYALPLLISGGWYNLLCIVFKKKYGFKV